MKMVKLGFGDEPKVEQRSNDAQGAKRKKQGRGHDCTPRGTTVLQARGHAQLCAPVPLPRLRGVFFPCFLMQVLFLFLGRSLARFLSLGSQRGPRNLPWFGLWFLARPISQLAWFLAAYFLGHYP